MVSEENYVDIEDEYPLDDEEDILLVEEVEEQLEDEYPLDDEEDILLVEEVEEQLEDEYHLDDEEVCEDIDTDTLRNKILELIEEDEEIRKKISEIVDKKKYNIFARIVGAIIEHFWGSIAGELAQDVVQNLPNIIEWLWSKVKNTD